MVSNKELVREISDLRKEIRELKDVVSMLVGMVMEEEMDFSSNLDARAKNSSMYL
ncbi:MAG: hypothetical protein QMC80_04405 [Thermoplasmatales archaeon]|nr:hypothetical protein [Thermoplasmatales archaeon]